MTQGFKDGTNISMMAITFWDLVKCLTGLVHRMFGPISLAAPGLATSWRNITFPYVEYTPVFASYVSYALATYVSVERCLCVSKPFTVKSMFTPKFTITMVTLISCVVFGAYLVMYFVYEIAYQFSPYLNETVAFYRYNAFYYNNEFIVMLYYKCVAIILPFSSFAILCLCSLTTLYFLRQSSRFLAGREHSSKVAPARFASGISQREKQVAKMLLAVVIVNIGNLFPRIVFYVGQLVEPEFYVLRRYHNFFMTVAKFLFILDFTNASVNFFIFFSLSSAFKATFYSTFGSSKYAVCKK
ncbi:unnamed protein product [Lymnaea stagnalis]|uniref:G-protein coupled receptors family 1 profile domain-containing protein n=1 Tax=Lymnaea stagnalis TaxID=6523 RepID=A0AAV2I5J6_LYMST